MIVVCGPTAVGKTTMAIQLAQHFNTEIISADSRQCFKEMNIGVAKPSANELQLVHHYFINSHAINDEMNAGVYEKYALQSVEEIFSKHTTAVMVGGTGLYIKAFCEGIDEMPAIDESIRKEITAHYELHGIEWLQNELKEKDPNFFAAAEQQNPHRLMRALEVLQATGKSISFFRKNNKVNRNFNIIKIGLELPKEKLLHNIDTRVDMMMQAGLLQEVQSLIPYKNLNALQTVGYRELFEYLDGSCSLEQAIQSIKTNTWHYAKRQMTWFKKQANIKWLDSNSYDDILSELGFVGLLD